MTVSIFVFLQGYREDEKVLSDLSAVFRASLLEQQKRDEEARKKKEKEEADTREKQK